jgi:predicted oxidoreductase
MRRALGSLVIGCLFLYTPSAHAATFKNCTEVNKVHKWGVSKSLAAAMKQKNYPINNPLVSASIYASLAKMDRDKDGTACEK